MSRRLLPPFVALTFALCVWAADEWRPPGAPKPEPVSLKLDKATTKQALAELTRQTRIPVDDRLDDPAQRLSLDLPKTNFWPALDAIARAAHGRVDLYPRDGGRLALVRQPVGYAEAPVSYSGLFRTSVKRITASKHFDTGASTYGVTLEVAWEPTLEPLYLETTPRSLTVRDDQGRQLPVHGEGRAPPPFVDRKLAMEFDVPLPAVPRSVPRLGLLEGKLAAIAPNKVVEFAFGSLERLADAPAGSPLRTQNKEGVACQIRNVRLARERWTVQVALDYPAGGVRLESFQSRVVNNEMVLESVDGSKRLTTDKYAIETPTDRKAVISYHFTDEDGAKRGRPADWKVSYRTPAVLVEVPLAFSFKDVPLP
jgi:hypothetical protein